MTILDHYQQTKFKTLTVGKYEHKGEREHSDGREHEVEHSDGANPIIPASPESMIFLPNETSPKFISSMQMFSVRQTLSDATNPK